MAPVEVGSVLDVDQVDPFDIGQFGLRTPRADQRGRVPLLMDTAIFDNRQKQAWPPQLTVYPSWAETYARLAAEEGFPIGDVEKAAAMVSEFILRSRLQADRTPDNTHYVYDRQIRFTRACRTTALGIQMYCKPC